MDLDAYMAAFSADGFLAALAAAPRLPALHLGLSDGRLSAPAVAQLGRLSRQLTSLVLWDVALGCTPAQLGDALRGLRGLRRLRLEYASLRPPRGAGGGGAATPHGMAPLVGALASLTRVSHLTLVDVPLDGAQAAALRAEGRRLRVDALSSSEGSDSGTDDSGIV